ncbi:MAG: hypothetical protein ABIT37_13075 [Luteolibacter sp.]
MSAEHRIAEDEGLQTRFSDGTSGMCHRRNWMGGGIFRGFLAWALLLLCNPMTLAAAAPKLAVIGGEKSDWNDMLMACMGDAVALVEREKLGGVIDEKVLQSLFENPKDRSRIGGLAGADFLVLLDAGETQVRAVVCDTHLGVTLQDLTFSTRGLAREEAIAALAKQTLGTVGAFTGGVKSVVAVSDFVSRDLTFEYSYLQSDYAEVLRAAYRQNPGVAIVAMKEAQAIAAERDLAVIEQQDRPVTVFIEGEYRSTLAPQGGEVGVEITLRARNSEKVIVERKLASMALSQAGGGLMAVFTKDLAEMTGPAAAMIDQAAQYRLLIERADAFGSLGGFQRSTALREAALLLKPDADDQRIRLVREYTRHNLQPYESNPWPKGANFDESNPLWVAASNQSVSDWKRSLQHCSYLILNRRLSREVATDLTHNAIHSICGVRSGSSNQLGECETLKKNFLRHVFSLVPSLDPATPEVRHKLTGALDAYHFLFEDALFRCDGNFYRADDLDLIADLLLNRLPDSMWPSHQLNFFLRDTATSLKARREAETGFNETEYLAFLDRLIASDRPLVNVYGRYGKECYRIYNKGEKSLALLEEARAIVVKAKTIGFDLHEYDYFMGQLKFEIGGLEYQVVTKNIHTVQEPPRKTPHVDPPAKSRISLEPIALTLVNSENKGKPLAPDMRWSSHGGWFGVTHFRSLPDRLDVLWSHGAVFFVPRPGGVIAALADEKLSVADVVGDGRYVWVGAFYGWGLSVLDRDGRELTRIDKEDGLPPCGTYGLVVHPIEPGRVLVAGSFGNDNRGWIAIVSFNGHKSQVKVIHEATKVWDYTLNDNNSNMDPHMTFVPQTVTEHVIPGPKPRRIVDPESLKVWVYPVNESYRSWFPRREPPNDAFQSIDGMLWIAGSMDDFSSFRFNQKTGLFDRVRERERWHAGNATSGSLARVGDWLYYAGSKWRRLNLKTGQEELLVEDLRALPDYGKGGGGWHIANSAHYGLVGFYEGKLYRVQIDKEK